MVKDYISKINPQKLIKILEEKGDFRKVNDTEDYRTYQYSRWEDTLEITVPITNPELNAYCLVSALNAVFYIRNTPVDFLVLRCLDEEEILSCIDKIRERVCKIEEESDTGISQDAEVQELFVLCGELQEIQYIAAERGFMKTAETAGNRLKIAEYAADMVIDRHCQQQDA